MVKPTRVVFTEETGWESDYRRAGRNGVSTGYRGTFPHDSSTKTRVLAHLASTIPSGTDTAKGYFEDLAGADRILIEWNKDQAIALVVAYLIDVDGLLGWHISLAHEAEGHANKRLRFILCRLLVREEPVDFIGTFSQQPETLEALKRLSPTRSLLKPSSQARSERPTTELTDSSSDSVSSTLEQVRAAASQVAGSAMARGENPNKGENQNQMVIADLSGKLTSGQARTRRSAKHRPSAALQTIAATGTNGKTSCVELGRQLMESTGRSAASFGTLGITTSRGRNRRGAIGPGPNGLPRLVERLWALGTDSLWAEAFSNALSKGLLDSLKVDVAIFTQIGVDHTSVHGSLAGYTAAKERLFETVVRPGGTVVLDPTTAGADRIVKIANRRNLELVTTGVGNMVQLVDGGLVAFGERFAAPLPFRDGIMARNLELVIGAALTIGVPAETLAKGISGLEFPPGRFMEVDVDAPFRLVIEAAHNGDALEVSLNHWRQQTSGRLLVLLASVGSSDTERWEPLGEVADVLADVVVVSDESPYGENASEIRSALLRGCPRATEIADRTEAITHLLEIARPEDIVMLMGRADEAFVVLAEGNVPYPTDESMVRSILANR